MNQPHDRADQIAELQRKLDNYLRLQQHVTQQQEAIESQHLLTKEALAFARQELESTQRKLDAALAQLQNAEQNHPSEVRLAQKDVIIAQQDQEILNLKSKVERLERENESLKNQNEDKSELIKLYKEQIVDLQKQIEKHDKDIEAYNAIYNSQVFEALIQKRCRLSCVENLRRLVNKEDSTDEIVKFFRSLRYEGRTAPEAANIFLAKYKRLQEFTPDQNKVLTEIGARVSDGSMVAIKAALDQVGDLRDKAGVQDDFFTIQKNDGHPNWAARAAEDFLEQHPNYLAPLTGRANQVLSEVKGRVTLRNYNRLKSDVTSDQRGEVNKNRVLFFRLVAEGRGVPGTAKKFIRESGTDFDGFLAKYF